MRAPCSRGPISALVLSWLTGAAEPEPRRAAALISSTPSDPDPILDEDRQVALWVLYELHYGGFEDVDDLWEWAPETLEVRRLLERDFETALRSAAETLSDQISYGDGDIASRFFDVTTNTVAPPLTAYLQRRATPDQMVEFLMHRSIYHLKEADPHSFAIPRLTGAAKAALVEIQYDEYGAGRPERLHATMFESVLDACGLDTEYGAYIEQVPAVTLAVNNAMSLFGLHRRLRAAAMGHLGAFEATSSLPAHRIARGMLRLGYPPAAAAYYEEHVEADAVHEQLAVRSICATMAADDPTLVEDLAFGAAACIHLDELAAQHLLDAWACGSSGLRLEREPVTSLSGA